MGKQISPNDYPRRIVYYLGWAKFICIMVPLFNAFRNEKDNEVMKQSTFLTKIGSEGALVVIGFFIENLKMANHIVGMLSSSWQGGLTISSTEKQ